MAVISVFSGCFWHCVVSGLAVVFGSAKVSAIAVVHDTGLDSDGALFSG